MKEDAVVTKDFKLEDTERIAKEREAFDSKGVVYVEKDRPFNDTERRFEFYRKKNPKSYKQHIRAVFRLLDERDLKEWIVIFAIKECLQKFISEDGVERTKPVTITGYWGFYDDPDVEPKEFNPDGTIKEAMVVGISRRYYIPWSREKLMEIINDPNNYSTTTNFYLGLASPDPSSDNAKIGTKYHIRNAEDFANHEFNKVLQLARSGLSAPTESMSTIQQTLDLRKRLGVTITTNENPTVGTKSESKKKDLTETTTPP